MRTSAILVMASVALIIGGCTPAMTSGAKLRNDLFWEAATQCESRYRTLHLDQIDIGGGITLHADAESRHELEPFRKCYRQAVEDRIEQRRRAGLPIPEELSAEPTAEID
jgi:hypothetical protein